MRGDSEKDMEKDGFCDFPKPLANFSAEAYMGRWYSIQHSSGTRLQQDNEQCVAADYSDLTADGKFVVSNQTSERLAVGEVFTAGEPAGWARVSFFGRQVDEANYKIIETDYETYSLVYACSDIGEKTVPQLWILARENTLDQAVIDKLNKKAARVAPKYDFNDAALDVHGDFCDYDREDGVAETERSDFSANFENE